MNRSFERLSSGLRINGPVMMLQDLASAPVWVAKLKVFGSQSVMQMTAFLFSKPQKALWVEVETMLQRMRELSVQAANGTYQDSDRASLQAEVSQLQDEIDNISERTNFNGIGIRRK